MFKAAMSVFVLLTIALLFSSPAKSTQTRLPERIVHRDSGITLVLVPAGRFQMGSPAKEPERSKNETQHWRDFLGFRVGMKVKR